MSFRPSVPPRSINWTPPRCSGRWRNWTSFFRRRSPCFIWKTIPTSRLARSWKCPSARSNRASLAASPSSKKSWPPACPLPACYPRSRMDREQAKAVLALYRPGREGEDGPELAEALAVAERDPEVARWLEERSAVYRAIKAKFKAIEIPDGLKEQILAERVTR